MPRDKRDDASYLADMLQFANEALEFVRARTRDDYDGSPVMRRAVERAIELIGEAASHVSNKTRDRHPEIPWRKIVAQRHVLIHGYGDVDDDLVWNLVQTEIPQLLESLQKIVR